MPPDEFRAWRARMGWTQARAADALGVDPLTVREWERGVGRVTGKPVSLPPMRQVPALNDKNTAPARA